MKIVQGHSFRTVSLSKQQNIWSARIGLTFVRAFYGPLRAHFIRNTNKVSTRSYTKFKLSVVISNDHLKSHSEYELHTSSLTNSEGGTSISKRHDKTVNILSDS